MKKLICSFAIVTAASLLSGCALSFGSSEKHEAATAPTLGQQLVDLKKAQDAGAITDAEYQAQKSKLLDNK